MSRRIDIELTSALADGSWTWRAAGAREPKGVLDGSILPDGAAVGDELKVEVEQMLDGIEILSVVKGRQKDDRNDLLELLPTEEKFEAVIQTRARRERGEGRDRKRGDRRSQGPRRGDKDGDRDDRRGGRGGQRRERPHFDPPPEVPQRPKPKRLRPGKTHRTEVLAEIPEEQRQIAELALQGMPAVRSRVKEENEKLVADGKPAMPEASVVKMAEELIPKLRVADWLDRAEAAQRQMKTLDLRDLRSVVAASDDPIVARDESTRALAEELKASLVTKQEEELRLWLEDVEAALGVGRVIRALRLSSQPPKAGVMFPPDLAKRLGEAASSSLQPEDSPDRWAAVMEAAAFSPVRTLVVPTAPPNNVNDDLKKTTLRLGPLLPQIAALLQVDVPDNAPRPKPLRSQPRRDAKRKKSGPSQSRPDRKDEPRRPSGRKGASADAPPTDTKPGAPPTDTKPDTPAADAAPDAPADTPLDTPPGTTRDASPDAPSPPDKTPDASADAPPTDTTPDTSADAPPTDTTPDTPPPPDKTPDTSVDAPPTDTTPDTSTDAPPTDTTPDASANTPPDASTDTPPDGAGTDS